MRNAAPMTFGARLARHRMPPEEVAWLFNVPTELPNDTTPKPVEPSEVHGRVQIGPLDI